MPLIKVAEYFGLYRYDGHATIFKFKQNSFRVHVPTYILLASFLFLSTAVKFYFYADLGKNKTNDRLID